MSMVSKFQAKAEAYKSFIQEGKFLSKQNDPVLYAWASRMKALYKKDRLPVSYISTLNSIGFVWDQRSENWERQARTVEQLFATQRIPSAHSQRNAYHWLRLQFRQFFEGKSDPSRQVTVCDLMQRYITLVQSAKMLREERPIGWEESFVHLQSFMKNNCDQLPLSDSTDAAERSLALWCDQQIIQYEKGYLSHKRYMLLNSAGIVFKTKAEDWTRRLEAFTDHAEINGKPPRRKTSLWRWASNQSMVYASFSAEQKRLWADAKMYRFFEPDHWQKRFEAVKNLVEKKGRLPRPKEKVLYDWLSKQKQKVKSDGLSAEQRQMLQSISVCLDRPQKELKWEQFFAAVQLFKEQQGRWPSKRGDAAELKLYHWCHAQRQRYAGKVKNASPLAAEKIALLNSIGFHWRRVYTQNADTARRKASRGTGAERLRAAEEQWEAKLQVVREVFSAHGKIHVQAPNGLYEWLKRQKEQVQRGRMSKERTEKIQAAGLTEFISSALNAGAKWEQQLKKLQVHFHREGKLPSRKKGGVYQWMKRQQAMIKKGNLSTDQKEKLRAVGIV